MEIKDINLIPPEPKQQHPYCPLCGEQLYWGEKVYLFSGTILGCDNCIEKRYPEQLDCLWK